MTDVFVSYSRSDEAFVRDLVAELTRRGKQAWVDWEGIPPTAEWLEEIRSAIESSDAFLFVISPHSAASKMCREELAHAEQLGKRIVPINLTEVDRAILPAALADRQWIMFADGRPFGESVETLVEALDTDLEWVGQHTQWLGKAREWKRSGRDGSFLLRGAELRAAEGWLTAPGAEDKEPPATPLQNEYVLASRHAATRRQRGFLAAVLVALAATAVLALAALVQRDRANAQREIAVSELAANVSGQRLESALDTAVLLAAAAYDVEETAAARDALLTGIRRTMDVARLLRVESPHPQYPPVSSGDGRLLAVANGEEIRITDVAAGEEIATIHAEDLSALALDDSGSLLATASRGRVTVRGVPSSSEVSAVPRVFRVPDAGMLAFAPRGGRLAIGTAPGRVLLLDVASGRLVAVPGLEAQSPVVSLAFDRSGATLAAGSHFGVHLADVGRQRYLRTLLAEEVVTSVAFTGENELAAVTGDGRLLVVDTRTDRRLCEPAGRFSTLHLDGAGRLAVGGRNGSVRLAREPCGRGGRALEGHGSGILAIGSVGDGGQLVSVDESGLVIVWELERSPLAESIRTGLEIGRDVVHGFSSDVVVVAGDSGVARVSATEPLHWLDADLPEAESLASAPSARVLVAAGRAARAWTGERYERAEWLPGRSMLSVAVSGDGELVALGGSRGVVEVWRVGTGSREARLSTGSGAPITALAADEGSRVAAGDTTGRIVVWNVGSDASPIVLQPTGDGETAVDVLDFSPDGALLAAVRDDLLQVFDLAGGTVPLSQESSVGDVTFAASGTLLISSHADGALQVWDVARGRRLGEPLDTGAEAIRGLDLEPSGATLAAVGDEGTVLRLTRPVWDAAAATERICALTGRDLAADEWRRVVTGFRVPAPCESGD